MQIRLTDIPPEGLNVNDTLSLENINARMNEAPNNDITFTQAPAVEAAVQKEKGGAEVTGKVAAAYKQVCPRCAQEVEHQVEKELSLILKRKESQPGRDRQTSKEEWGDDIGILYFDGEHIDLEDVIQETLILSLSPYGATHDNCKSVLEGQKKEEDSTEGKTSLGKLLKDAGIH